MAKRKTLFDDKSTEISELIYVIKHDIAELNNDIGNLQMFVKARRNNARTGRGKKGSELNEHSDNVVVLLQSKLANTSMGFKEVLEIRTQVYIISNIPLLKSEYESFQRSIRAIHLWSGSFGHSTTRYPSTSVSSYLVLSSSSPLYNPIPRPHSTQPNMTSGKGHKSDLLTLNMDEEESAIGIPSQFQQMQLVERQDQYLSQRGQAIESIESTIHELGSIFQQLAQMVSEQAETVQRYTTRKYFDSDLRIDANTDDIVTNVGGAQRELLKYYARVTSNRWLMIKIFGVLIIFFLLWVLVS